jgi:hypothetical protein
MLRRRILNRRNVTGVRGDASNPPLPKGIGVRLHKDVYVNWGQSWLLGLLNTPGKRDAPQTVKRRPPADGFVVVTESNALPPGWGTRARG